MGEILCWNVELILIWNSLPYLARGHAGNQTQARPMGYSIYRQRAQSVANLWNSENQEPVQGLLSSWFRFFSANRFHQACFFHLLSALRWWISATARNDNGRTSTNGWTYPVPADDQNLSLTLWRCRPDLPWTTLRLLFRLWTDTHWHGWSNLQACVGRILGYD